LTALVWMAELSEPASFSVRAKQAKVIFSVSGVRNFFFCSSLPKRTMGVVARVLAMIDVYMPAQPQASSSQTMVLIRVEKPAPLYSAGIPEVRKPASKAFCMISRGNSFFSSYS
jgi:hypothetical protein